MMVEVAVKIAGAVVAERPVKLDALLEWSVAREMGLPWLSRAHGLPPPLPIPIDFVEYGDDNARLNLCTDWVITDATPYRHTWVRRRDSVDVESLSRSFNPSYGPGRDLLLRAYGVQIVSARWLVSTPDPDRVAALLRRVTHLGKLRAHGCGELGGPWSVQPVDAPTIRTLVDDEGRAARALPVAMLASWEGPEERLATAPPYWHPARHMRAVAQGTPVVLRDAMAQRVGAA